MIREARPSDKNPIMAFVKDIWRGHDYIPRVWDYWIRDRSGRIFVAEVDERPVAMNRIRFMEDGSAWLEGARVHPSYRRRGLATLLGRSSMEFARKRGVRTFRLTSGSNNKPAHKQVAKMGLVEVARMNLYSQRSGSRFKPPRGVRRAKPSEIPATLKKIKESREFGAGGGVYWDQFAATSITRKTLSNRAREGSVYLAGNAVAIATVVRGDGSDTWRQICFATGPTQEVARIVKYIFGRRERVRTTWSIVYAPSRSPLARTLAKAGLTRWGSFLLFEGRALKS